MRIVEREERTVRHNARTAFTGRLDPNTGLAYGRVVIGPRYRFVRETDRHGKVTVTAERITFNAVTFEYDAKLLHRWEGIEDAGTTRREPYSADNPDPE